jgi:integrase
VSTEIALRPTDGTVAEADLSAEDWSLIQEYVAESLAPETRRSYLSLLGQFAAWCRSAGRNPLPADEATVAAYLTYMARTKGLKPSTIKMAKSAISTMHDRARQPNPTKNDMVRDVIRGIDRKHRGGRVKKARAATGSEILAMAAESTRLVDKRDAAILLVGFGAAMRRSEIVNLDVEDVWRDRHGRTLVHIAFSKTDQTGEGEDAVLPDEAADAVWHWLSASELKSGPLFPKMGRGPVGQEGKPTRRRLSGNAVRDIIRARADAAGLDDSTGPTWSGHSLRRGAATEADANGASEISIKRLGRWKSMTTVAQYVDKNKDVTDLSALLGLKRDATTSQR